ncbi:MAG: ABC transporter substrate-binding protein [Bacteroidota bacterium]
MEKLTLALDWTPNANHIGFLVAKENGYYVELDLEVEILSPGADNYQVTPAKKVELGQANFALCPMESVLSYRTKKTAFPLKAIAAIFREDVSAIAVLESSGIKRPKELDGKVYASYKARYEDEIVKSMIKNDDGKGEIEISYPDKLGIWENLLTKKSDATWIFMNWEGVAAEGEGIRLNTFRMTDYDIPYSYSPVVVASEENISKNKTAYSKFLKATKRGFLQAAASPEEAATILKDQVAATDANIDLVASIKESALHFRNEEKWGVMETKNVQQYLDWIYSHNLESEKIEVEDLVTNELL